MPPRRFAWPRCGRTARAAALLTALACGGEAAASPQDAVHDAADRPQDSVLYRVFLHDGSMLVSYGEFARVGDGVVISIPLGGTETVPALHLLTIADADVDWERTDAYARAARAQRYAETRGEADFARLTREVAGTLHQVGLVSDSAQRLALAEQARRQLVDWPRLHHRYRAEEIAQLATSLDQVVSELRIAAGLSTFDLALVAPLPAAAPAVTLLPPPNVRERVEFALTAVRRTPDAATRVSLLRAVLEALQPIGPDGSWVADVRARAAADLAAELRINRAYADLTRRTLGRAEAHARNMNVGGLEALVPAVLEEDKRLQQARPAEVAALLATLDARIDASRRLRLARDAWALRRTTVLNYWTAIREPLDRLIGIRKWLTDVRQLAGPAPASARRLANHAALAAQELARIRPPAEVASVHATFGAAAALASRASAARLDAVRSGSMDTAWQASSAAAGSLMLLAQGLDDLRSITYAPAPTVP
jgi:hypothetical protein